MTKMWGRKFIAYLAAILAISAFIIVTSGLMIAANEVERGIYELPFSKEGYLETLWTGMFVIFVLALPIWLIGDTYATWYNITHAGWFVKTGAAITAAIVILSLLGTIGFRYTGGIGQLGGIALLAMLGAICGGLGGYVYWAIALRRAGQA